MGFLGRIRRFIARPHEKGKRPTVVTVLTTPVSPAKITVNRLFSEFTRGNHGLHARAEKANEYLRGIASAEPDITRFAKTADNQTVKQAANAIETQLKFNRAFLGFLEKNNAPARAIEQLNQEIASLESSLESIQ